MKYSQSPNIGERFKIAGVEFEISAVQHGSIRYASVAGGKIYHFSVEQYQKLLKLKQLVPCINRVESEDILPDQLSEKETEIMNRKLGYVREIYKYAKYPTSKKEIAPIIERVAENTQDQNPPSCVNVSRWIKTYISSNQNPMSLAPKTKNRGNRQPYFGSIIDNIINRRIERDYLTTQRLSAIAVRENIIGDIKSEFDDLSMINLPSKRTIHRRISQIDPYKRLKGRHGKYVANKLIKAAGRGKFSTRSLEVVEADGNILDVLVLDKKTGEIMGRPYGTCLIDIYSRCVIGFVVTMIPFSSATLLKTLKTAISGNNGKFGGLFESMIVDNGSDYISHSVRNFCNHTGIRIEHGAPRDPNSKPHVERFFDTLNTQLVHTLPGTTFSNPADKGDYNSDKYACLTLEDLNNFIEQWLETIYHKSIHRGHGRAPEKLWAEGIKNHPITTYPIEHLDTIAREVSQRRISKGRITAHNLKWFSHALATIEQDCKNKGIPAKVEVYIDSLDLGKVFVKDPRDHTIFIQADAVFPNYADGLSLYEHKIIWDNLKAKGREDFASYSKYYLEIARWKLFEEIGKHSKEYSKKRIARIKETNKKNKQAKIILDKQISKCNSPHQSKAEPLESIEHEFLLIDNTHDLNKKTDQDTPDSYTFERF